MIGWAVAKGAWTIFKASPIARTLAKIGGMILLVLTFGAWNRQRGAQGQKARQAVKDAKAHKKTIEEVLRETVSDDPADDIRRRMRERSK